MSETVDKNNKPASANENTHKPNPKDRRIADLEQRLSRIEKRVKNNERFAKTFADCASSQIIAIDAITEVVRRGLREDSEIHEEISSAIKEYDRRKITRWFSGFLGVLLRVAALCVAGFMGAFIYWVFSGQ